MGDFEVHNVRFYNVYPYGIHCLACDGKRNKLAVGRSDNWIEIWDFKGNFYCEKVIGCNGQRSVEALCWNNKRLFSTGLNGDLTEYDMETLLPKMSTIVTPGACWCMSQNSKKSHVAIGTEDGQIFMYRFTPDGAEYEKIIGKQEKRVLSVAWHPTDDVLVTGSMDYLSIWNVATCSVLHHLDVGRGYDLKQETAIWTVTIDSDHTIVSGDSCGRVMFWNGKLGTLISTAKPHKADVLCLSFNEDRSKLYASGVDPVIYVYTRLRQREWVKSVELHGHCNDVKAICSIGDKIVSGGIDGYIRFSKDMKKWGRPIPPIPQHSAVTVANQAKSVLLQYRTHMELWRLDRTGPYPKPTCLLKAKAPESEAIVRSTVSTDSRWIAYATPSKLRLLQLNIISVDHKKPVVTAEKVRSLPTECNGTSTFLFTPDVTKLLVATPSGDLHVLSVSDKVQTLCTISQEELGLRDGIQQLAVSGDSGLVAAADHSGSVCVVDLAVNKVSCPLPKRRYMATALSFHPTSKDLVVAYSDGIVQEVDTTIGSYTKFGRSLEGPLISGHRVISDISFDVAQPQIIILRAEDVLFIVDKEQVMNGVVTDRKSRYGPGISACDQFEHLAYGGNLGTAGTLLMVEVSPDQLAVQLPPVLRIYRFGA